MQGRCGWTYAYLCNIYGVREDWLKFSKNWDDEFGGILYFMDCLGNPPEAYEHDMKLWWPHNEALIASMMIYRDTKDEKYLGFFYQILDYCKKYFADEYGEWYGYLRRDASPPSPPARVPPSRVPSMYSAA